MQPRPLRPRTSRALTFIVTLMVFLEGDAGSRKFGVWLALIFSLVATILASLHAREDAR